MARLNIAKDDGDEMDIARNVVVGDLMEIEGGILHFLVECKGLDGQKCADTVNILSKKMSEYLIDIFGEIDTGDDKSDRLLETALIIHVAVAMCVSGMVNAAMMADLLDEEIVSFIAEGILKELEDEDE